MAPSWGAVWQAAEKRRRLLSKIDACISHLAECQRAAFERASPAAGADACEECVAHELLGREIPKRQPLERHQDRTHFRLKGSVELSILGLDGLGKSRRYNERPQWNDRECS